MTEYLAPVCPGLADQDGFFSVTPIGSLLVFLPATADGRYAETTKSLSFHE